MENSNSNVPSLPGDPFERFAVGDSNLRFGDLLKHNGKNGGWCSGIDNDPIDLGTQFVAIYEESYVGFVKWVDAKPDQRLLPLRSSPDLKALRKSIGDHDQTLWSERTAAVRPRDPWRPAAMMPIVNPATRETFTFSTSNAGGYTAVRNLIGDCITERRDAPEKTRGCLPLVALGEQSYQPSDRRFGTIFNPVFELVDWVPVGAIAETLLLIGIELPTTEHSAPTPTTRKPTKHTGRVSIADIDDSEPDVSGGGNDTDEV